MDNRVRTVLRSVELNWNKRIRLVSLARAVNLSSSRLTHLFKKEVGVCIREYVTERRLKTAEALLSSTYLSIKQVAYECGFLDLANFSRSFKKKHGASPKEYRQRVVTAVSTKE
jgi:transcriptional regulator GlxA family with amidase domain